VQAAEQAAAKKALNDMNHLVSRKLDSSSSSKRLNIDEDVDDFPAVSPAPKAGGGKASATGAGSSGGGGKTAVEDDWEALADEPADSKPVPNHAGGRGRGRDRGAGKGGSQADIGRGSSVPSGCAQVSKGAHSHGVLNFNITADDLEISPDEAKGVLQKSLGLSAGGLQFVVGCIGSAHAPVFQATVSIEGAGGLMGDLVGRGDAPNKKMAEKMAALDACVKLAQLGRLMHVPKPPSRGGGGGAGGGGKRGDGKKAQTFAGDVGAVPLCASREQMEELCRIAGTLEQVPSRPMELQASQRVDELEDDVPHRPADEREVEMWNRRHMELQQERAQTKEYNQILEKRKGLPGYQMRDKCTSTILANQVTIIAGDTGCGKTTQVPQAYMDHEIAMGRGGRCHCVVTQPRRVSAISVAERVAAERAEPLGQTVGYQIRQESVLPRSTGSILFCTTGVLTRKLTGWAKRRANGQGGDGPNISVVFVDEVHERDVNSDFLLIVLKRLIDEGANIKVVLMSATMNAEKFSHFFGYCPIITIPGRMFDVEELYIEDYVSCVAGPLISQPTGGNGVEAWRRERLERGRERARATNEFNQEVISLRCKGLDVDELAAVAAMSDVNFVDYDLLAELILFIDRDEREGAILVFLPGWEEITSSHDILLAHPDVQAGLAKLSIFKLHSNVSPQEQQQVFRPVPAGVRKVVLSTNIAETSVTLDDCVFVIDSGRAKRMTYDPVTQISSLETTWAAKANVKQRKGRAGRVREGVCYRLYTSAQHQAMEEEQDPEILVVPLEQICLSTLALGLGRCQEVLACALDAPPASQIDTALKTLKDLGATDDEQKLTVLGHKLSLLHMEPRLAKMLLTACAFRCLRPLLAVAAAREYRDPFMNDPRAESVRVMMSDACQSDQLLMADVMGRYQEALCHGGEARAGAFCHEHMLNPATMRQMHGLQLKLADMVVKAGLVHGIDPKRAAQSRANAIVQTSDWEHDAELVRAMICTGLLPNAARVCDKGGKRRMLLKEGGKISAQSKSVLQLDRILSGSGFVCFHELIKTSQLYAADLCYAGTLPVAIFASKVETCAEGIVCDGWMRLSVDKAGAAAILAIRAAAKRCVDRHICGVGIGSKSAEVDLEGVLDALNSVHTPSASKGGGDRYSHYPHRVDAPLSSSNSELAQSSTATRVLQYAPAREAFRRDLDRGGGGGGGYGGGYDRGGHSGRGGGHVADRGGGAGSFRERDERGGAYWGRNDRYASERGGVSDADRDWRGTRDNMPRGGRAADFAYEQRHGGSRVEGGFGSQGGLGSSDRGGGADLGGGRLYDSGCTRDARLDELSKTRFDSGSSAPVGNAPMTAKYVPPSRRII
jgi:ATP-dependent RNA helicase DHX36